MANQVETNISTDRSGAWLFVAVLALLILACLAGIAINQAGIPVDGQRVHLRLVSAVTNYPFCPPEIPCPISMVLPSNHWVVWILRDTRPDNLRSDPAAEFDLNDFVTYRKLIDIPLGW